MHVCCVCLYLCVCTCLCVNSCPSCYVPCRREKHDIPLLVQTCVDEVERRGMDETGIYRVAGVISDVEALRKAFDSGSSHAHFAVQPCPFYFRLFASSTVMCRDRHPCSSWTTKEILQRNARPSFH